jgi:hypothetical protein
MEAERVISLVVGKSFPVGGEGVQVATFPTRKRRHFTRSLRFLRACGLLE